MSTAASSVELSKSYDPSAIEPEIYQAWLDEKCFHAEPTDAGEPYSIVIPPPNVTGALHLGHALNNTLQDILMRKARMEGKNAVWIPGLDHAGIATQAVVEKQLKEQENKTRHDVGREGLVERIWKWKQQYGDRIISQLKRMGCSCDWDRQRFTLDEMCAKAVRETFFKLFKDGLVYRGKRLVNWDTHLQTSISDDELYTETVKTNLWSIRYPIVPRSTGFQPVSGAQSSSGVSPVDSSLSSSNSNSNKEGGDDENGRDARATLRAEHGLEARATSMVVATTRPETMLADTAVAVHPDDPRWNWAIGLEVELPLTKRRIPIIGDPILVDMNFGSGCVKVTPAHDPNDYAVYTRHKGTPTEIAILNLMTPDGKVNDADASWAKYTGLTFASARKMIVEDLQAGGFMTEADIKPHEANVSFSDRSKTAIQPYLSDQWFVKMAPLAEPALEVVRDGTIKFFPERHAQQYLSWLGEKRDWPISRQLWWGHRIPIWHKRVTLDGGGSNLPKAVLIGGDPEVQLMRIVDATTRETKSNAPSDIRELRGEFDLYFCTTITNTQLLEKSGFIQDPDVLDTWFSSALWPHSTLGWPEKTADLAKWYPTSVLLTGRDIITLWVARMVMTGIYNMGDEKGERRKEQPAGSSFSSLTSHFSSAIPFHHVAINPTILDGKGERMSKSKGNGVDPVDIIELYGADAMRFTLTTMATETQDVRMPVKKLADGRNSSEKFDLGRNFCNKLWNASRFAFANIESARTAGTSPPPRSTGILPVSDALARPHGLEARATGSLSLVERWILSRLTQTIHDANQALSVYRFDLYAKACYDFFWRDFCDWYVEIIKPDFKDASKAQASARTLADVLDATLRLMHPMTPFITEKLWGKLNEIREEPAASAGANGEPAGKAARIIKAPWPVIDALDEDAEHVFSRLQDIVGVIRNLRNEHKVDQKKVVVVSLAPPGDEAVRVTRENVTIIENLATCRVRAIESNLTAPAGAVRTSVNGCEIYIEGLSDPAASAQVDEKKRAELVKKISAMKGRLSNESYIAKAPAKLVEETKQQLADAEAELAKLG